jgi:mitochondrial fission protein ELM1
MHTGIIWALADDRAGNANQAIGLAEALSSHFTLVVKTIRYNKLAKLPNILRHNSLIGIDQKQSSDIAPPWPDIIISAGRKTATVAAYIKKYHNPACKIIQIMWPGYPTSGIDYIITPQHDKIYLHTGAEIIYTTGSICRAKQGNGWHPNLPSPFIGVIIGGNSKHGRMIATDAINIVKYADHYAKQMRGSLLITTSRRTPREVELIIRQNLDSPHYMFSFNDSLTQTNPYQDILQLSDLLLVTGDSISMCSEVCSTGKPVIIYAPSSLLGKKHKYFIDNVKQENYASVIDEATQSAPLVTKPKMVLDETHRVADMLLAEIGLSKKP